MNWNVNRGSIEGGGWRKLWTCSYLWRQRWGLDASWRCTMGVCLFFSPTYLPIFFMNLYTYFLILFCGFLGIIISNKNFCKVNFQANYCKKKCLLRSRLITSFYYFTSYRNQARRWSIIIYLPNCLYQLFSICTNVMSLLLGFCFTLLVHSTYCI